MADVLLGATLWFGVSLVAVFMFSLGAGLGRRAGWEEGFSAGLREGARDRASAWVRARHRVG